MIGLNDRQLFWKANTWCWDDQFWKDVNRYFEHTLISYFVKKMSEHRYDIRISEAVLIRIR